MRYVLAILVGLMIAVAAAAPTAVSAQEDGPSVCQYRGGTVLNVGGWPCYSPYWDR